MEIKLEISDEKFNEFFGDIDKTFTEEMKEEALHEAVKIWAATDEAQRAIKDTLFEHHKDYYGDRVIYTNLTDAGKNVLIQAILGKDDFIEDIQNQLTELFRKNGDTMIIKVLAEVVIRSFTNSDAFRDTTVAISENVAQSIVYNYQQSLHQNQY